MPISEDAIRQARHECVARLDAKRQEVQRIEGELAAYDNILSGSAKEATERKSDKPFGLTSPGRSERSRRMGQRFKAPSGTWEAVVEFIGDQARSGQEIRDFLRTRGVDMPATNLRSQMANYRKNGFVSADDEPGTYSLTEEGKEHFGIGADPRINGSEARVNTAH